MSKLLWLKEWLTLEEAAEMLSVSTDSIVHLAARAKIRLHVLLPAFVRVRPIWHSEDNPSGKNLCHAFGLPVDQPIELSYEDWKVYENEEAIESEETFPKVKHILNSNLPGWEHASTPPGIEFCGWEFLYDGGGVANVYIDDCSIVMIQSEFQRLNALKKSLNDGHNLSPSISGPTIERLQRAIADFPNKFDDYRAKPPFMKEITYWLNNTGISSNSREGMVFGKILAEHFKFSSDT
jgi:hypothetical protein